MDYKILGERIRTCRKMERMTQEFLAERIGVSANHICYVENGKRQISLPLLERIAMELHTEISLLICPAHGVKKVKLAGDFFALISDCSSRELQILYDMCSAQKEIIRHSSKSK